MENINSLNVDYANVDKEEYKPPTQSADSLFHFVEKLEYLLPIIERFALVPRYCTEDVDYLDIGYKKLAYPMLCFCDINLHKLHDHIHFYGGDGYGIAFAKKWGMENAIQPIQYINLSSPLKRDFTTAFNDSIKSDIDSTAQDYLLTQMLFFKPILGTMDRNEETVRRNFTDECEWRYVPDLRNTELPQVVREENLFSKANLNKALVSTKACWLRFQPDDIKYIILKLRDEFERLTELLYSKNLNNKITNMLISKTIIWGEEKGDF